MNNQLNDGLNAIEKAKQKLRDEVAPNMHDKSIPFDERWAIFVTLAKAGVLDHNGYGDGYLRELQGTHCELTQYDDFHNDRGETVSFEDMHDHIVENPENFEGCDVDGWREHVISKGYGTFEYDW